MSPCLFNFYAEYIMRNAGLEEAQTGIKIARRNINNLRYEQLNWTELTENIPGFCEMVRWFLKIFLLLTWENGF